jgi:predicted amino acid-binding ACT domain protein
MIGSICRVLERKIRQAFLKPFEFKGRGLFTDTNGVGRAWCDGEEGTGMRRNDKSWMESDEPLEPFLPVEQGETVATVAAEFRNRLVKLEQQVMSQYTSMAAYATIAKHDSEAVKVEARADLDRSQATVIGLLEKLRNEVNGRLDRLERRTGGDLSVDDVTRLGKVEVDLASATAALQQCLQENQELRAQLAVVVEHRMQEQGWLVSSGTTEGLSLR